MQSIYQTYKRYRSLRTHTIRTMPIAVLMPHSSCNCRCVMCDIWKGNNNLRQLTVEDVSGLLTSFRKLGTRQVLMSGGEALLNPLFFNFCDLLKSAGIKICLLSTGMTLKKHAVLVAKKVDSIIVSLDGDEELHDIIRNIPGAFRKLREGIAAIREQCSHFPIAARTVIHRLNYQHWPAIIETALELKLDSISFLPADISSQAFNREEIWTPERQAEIAIAANELPALKNIIDSIITNYRQEMISGFIVESDIKLRKIYQYYAACNNLEVFPETKCNAPWVSAVVEADGMVKPCFFLPAYGYIKDGSLNSIVNSEPAIAFRKSLDTRANDTCRKCVCSLYLSPSQNAG